jgi:hypothetical protein
MGMRTDRVIRFGAAVVCVALAPVALGGDSAATLTNLQAACAADIRA